MKQTIEEAAESRITKQYTAYKVRRAGFITGAYSEAAKEFHTQGMYSEEQLRKLLNIIYDKWVDDLQNMYKSFDEWYDTYKKKIL